LQAKLQNRKTLDFIVLWQKTIKNNCFAQITKIFKHKKHVKKMSDLVNSYVPQVVNQFQKAKKRSF
jgi:hypothetical protein